MTEPPSSPSRNAAIEGCARALVARGSLEMSSHRPEDARRIAALLAPGTAVYVPIVPRETLEDELQALVALHEAGLDPVPHVAARRIASRREAEDFLAQAVERAHVRRVLVIGGDQPTTAGPFSDGASVLRDDLLAECGIRQVGLPGYPEGHPRIPAEILEVDLAAKIALARGQGLAPYVVTQFSFAPARIVEYCAALEIRAPGIPVYCGLPGPASPATLLKYAQRCGVSASLRALQAQGLGAIRLITQTEPIAQLHAIAQHCAGRPNGNVAGLHVFSFGGVERSATWMREQLSFTAAARP